MFKLPLIKKQNITLDDVRLIGYDKVNQCTDKSKIVHFFLDDNRFGSIWSDTPDKVETLKPYRAVLSPDFSMFVEMPIALQLYSCFKSRWVGAYLQENGVTIIPTVRWGSLESFNFCFDSIEQESVVAVSTIGVKNNKSHFMLGYNEMLRRIKPEAVICYGKPFEEMKGKIIPVDYAETNNLRKEHLFKKTFFGYVGESIKGGGSASGDDVGNPKPKWSPKKKADERFIGKPGEIKESNDGPYRKLTKIGDDGRAVMERHFSDHNTPGKHSAVHDHIVDWSKGYPDLGQAINYFDGNIPLFKYYTEDKSMDDCIITHYDYEPYGKFDDIDEFKFSIEHGREVVIEYRGLGYAMFKMEEENSNYMICESYKPETEKTFMTVEELLDYKIKTGDSLRSIITEAEVLERNL